VKYYNLLHYTGTYRNWLLRALKNCASNGYTKRTGRKWSTKYWNYLTL